MKLEFSQYKKILNDGSEPKEYFTIRQLIDLELAGQEERRTNQSDDIKELRELEKKANKSVIAARNNPGGRKIAFENYHEKIQKIKDPKNENKINIGMFYDSSEIIKNPILYRTSDDLRKTAPMLMEYYDREQNKESNFLKEWEIVYAGDSYEINKKIFIKQCVNPLA